MPAFAANVPGLGLILLLSAAAFGLAQVGVVQHYGLGPLTLAFMLARPSETRIKYPEEAVYTG